MKLPRYEPDIEMMPMDPIGGIIKFAVKGFIYDRKAGRNVVVFRETYGKTEEEARAKAQKDIDQWLEQHKEDQ